jgi:hypothetical protein
MGVPTGIRPAATLASLAAEYPGWHVWRGRNGRGADEGWFATRRRRLPAAGAAAGLVATLSAGDATSLEDMLEQQRVIEGQGAGSML